MKNNYTRMFTEKGLFLHELAFAAGVLAGAAVGSGYLVLAGLLVALDVALLAWSRKYSRYIREDGE